MNTVFAYSIVYREKDGSMKHYISHCWARSKQEAKGTAHDEFENDFSDCKLLSLLIREITTSKSDAEATSEQSAESTSHTGISRITPEFTLKNYLET